EFQELEDDFAATYQPATPAEQDLVNEMVAARWRINRIRTIETVIMDCEMVRKKAEIEKTFLQPDSGIHMGMAFRTLAEESRSLSLCNRYESRFSRMYERAYRTLRELQQKAAEPKKQKAEPEPPEPPKPNGGIQIAAAPERVQPSEPETKNKETNPSTVARAFLGAASRLPAIIAGRAAKLVTEARSKMTGHMGDLYQTVANRVMASRSTGGHEFKRLRAALGIDWRALLQSEFAALVVASPFLTPPFL